MVIRRDRRPHIPNIGKPDKEIRAKAGTIDGIAPLLILLLLGSPVLAQNAKPKDNYLRNIQLCNGFDRTALETRIGGCTALIDAGQGTATALAIAYNNRGNAYAAKADYDRAIQDFDCSIKLNSTYTKPFNNRGVAYLRKGEYDLAVKAFDSAISLNPNYSEAFANRAEAYLKKMSTIARPGTMTRQFVWSPTWRACGTDVVGHEPSLVRCGPHSRTATQRSSRV
jgi:tetratricopeptide (TPR) repeat protein